jgi:hypothetical protein
MDASENQLRKALEHGPAGYRDLEIWEIVSTLHQERFGVGSRDEVPGFERPAPAANDTSSQPASPGSMMPAGAGAATPCVPLGVTQGRGRLAVRGAQGL